MAQNWQGEQILLTSMISNISTRVILPSPSRSYILKAQLSFCSKLPLEVMDSAHINSLKSMVPSPFLSKVLKACWANFDASPYGKNCKGRDRTKKILSYYKKKKNLIYINYFILNYLKCNSICGANLIL